MQVGAAPHCSSQAPSDCAYPAGGYPVDVDFHGAQNQVKAAIEAKVQHVLLVSSMGGTVPNGTLDQLGQGWLLFYKLNAEAFIMNSGLLYTIIQPGGLTDAESGKALLVVGHEDSVASSSREVSRSDIAQVLTEACLSPELATNTRFDLVGDASKPPTNDWARFFSEAKHVV